MNPYTYAGLITSARKENKVTIQHLYRIIEQVTGVTEKQIKNQDRHKHIVHARKIVGYFCRQELGLTTTECGNIISRDHSTIIYYLSDAEGLFKYDPIFKNKYDKVLKLMEDKNLITFGAETVKTMCIEKEAKEKIKELSNRKYL
jgi:chromosomal replication initiation ATPase DnaA